MPCNNRRCYIIGVLRALILTFYSFLLFAWKSWNPDSKILCLPFILIKLLQSVMLWSTLTLHFTTSISILELSSTLFFWWHSLDRALPCSPILISSFHLEYYYRSHHSLQVWQRWYLCLAVLWMCHKMWSFHQCGNCTRMAWWKIVGLSKQNGCKAGETSLHSWDNAVLMQNFTDRKNWSMINFNSQITQSIMFSFLSIHRFIKLFN